MEEENRIHKRGLESDRQRVTCRLIVCIAGAAMGSLQFGFNTGVINAPESLLKAFINSTTYKREGRPMSPDTVTSLWALTASIFAVGGCIGGFSGGWAATRLGRKGGSLANISLGVLAAALMYFSKRAESYEMIIIGRMIVGIHCGLYTTLSPLYLSEISSADIRGAVGVLHQLATVTGILLSQVLGFPDILGNDSGWDILLGLCVVPCVLQLAILPSCPESPRYLLINKQDERACRAALQILRDRDNVEDEIDEIKGDMNTNVEKVSILQLFKSPALRPPLIIGLVMHMSQQFSGIIGVFYYSTGMFEDVGLSPADAKYTTSAVGAIMVTMTFITVPLMDRAGRRTLHLTGLAGMAVFSIVITVALALKDEVTGFKVVTIPAMLTYVVFFAVGPGSIPWLIVSELFSHNARSAAMSLCVLTNWISNFLVGFIFPYLQEALGAYIFLPFTILLVLFFLFTFFKVPETKGKTFEEVTAIWRTHDHMKSWDDVKQYGAMKGSGADAIVYGDKDEIRSFGLDNSAFSALPNEKVANLEEKDNTKL